MGVCVRKKSSKDSPSPSSHVNERGPMMAVYLRGIEVRVSFSKACADWTAPAGFQGKVSFPPDLETHLPEARRPGRCPCRVFRVQ